MFVRSRIDKTLTFRKNGKSWTLKPHAVTLIDDATVTAKEIKGCYGSRVEVISDEGRYKEHKVTVEPARQIVKNVVKSKVEEPVKKVEPVVKTAEEITLDDILEQVNKELGEIEVDDKGVDTLENNETAPVGVDTGSVDDLVPEDKDTGDAKVPVEGVGDTTKAKKKTEKTKSTRTRRTTSKKTSTKRSTKRVSKNKAK